MILQSLDRYYDRLHAEKDSSGKPKVPAYGFSEEKIGWIIILSREGNWIDLKPHLTLSVKNISRFYAIHKTAAYWRFTASWENGSPPNFKILPLPTK